MGLINIIITLLNKNLQNKGKKLNAIKKPSNETCLIIMYWLDRDTLLYIPDLVT